MRISDWSSDVCSSDLIVDRDEHRDAAADLLLHIVDRAAQPLGVEPLDALREQLRAADLLDRRAATRRAAAHREPLLRLGDLALGLPECLGHRRDPRRHPIGTASVRASVVPYVLHYVCPLTLTTKK